MIETNFDASASGDAKGDMEKRIRAIVRELARTWETEAKRIATDGALDTGQFAASIHHEIFEEADIIGFLGVDGVAYGIYHEFGTISHWVPFYAWTGDGYDVSRPVLADWAHRVLGMTEEEMLKQGGMMVEIDELRPFTKAMEYAKAQAPKIVKKHLKRDKPTQEWVQEEVK